MEPKENGEKVPGKGYQKQPKLNRPIKQILKRIITAVFNSTQNTKTVINITNEIHKD